MIGFRASDELRRKIEAWAKLQNDLPVVSEALRRLVEIGPSAAPHLATSKKTSAKAAEMAAETIERLANPALPSEERASRKRRLLKGPKEFREIRADQAKRRR